MQKNFNYKNTCENVQRKPEKKKIVENSCPRNKDN